MTIKYQTPKTRIVDYNPRESYLQVIITSQMGDDDGGSGSASDFTFDEEN